MKILVLSDSHRRQGSLLDIVSLHKNADAVIFLGDGEDDIETIKLLYPKLTIYQVCGNCDYYSSLPESGVVTLSGKKIFYTHGHRYRVKFGYESVIEAANDINADICLFGHTHNQYTNYDEGLYIMNPGSVGDGEYGIIDITSAGIMLNPQSI